jgi:hypothetical protein
MLSCLFRNAKKGAVPHMAGSEPAEFFQKMQPGSEFGGEKLGMQFFAIFLQPRPTGVGRAGLPR